MSTPRDRSRRYIAPRWPDEPFFLEAIPDGWTIGPFGPNDWAIGPAGDAVYADGITHPVVLRVRGQERDVTQNDGSLREMSYRVIPVSKAPPEWLGRR